MKVTREILDEKVRISSRECGYELHITEDSGVKRIRLTRTNNILRAGSTGECYKYLDAFINGIRIYKASLREVL